MQQAAYKQCPSCRAVHPLDVQVCGCGHRFRTQFPNPVQQTQAFVPQPQPVRFQPHPMADPITTKPFEWWFAVCWAWGISITSLLALLYTVGVFRYQGPYWITLKLHQATSVLVLLAVLSACTLVLVRSYRLVDRRLLHRNAAVALSIFAIAFAYLIVFQPVTPLERRASTSAKDMANVAMGTRVSDLVDLYGPPDDDDSGIGREYNIYYRQDDGVVRFFCSDGAIRRATVEPVVKLEDQIQDRF